jgi:Holliday junction resolvase-like predicted endonuclease
METKKEKQIKRKYVEELVRKKLDSQGYKMNHHQDRVGVSPDIIAEKDDVLHFVEVKSVKVRDCHSLENLAVKPEDNLTFSKWKKLVITVESYLQNIKGREGAIYQIDLACVYIDTEKREGRVKLISNIHKER